MSINIFPERHIVQRYNYGYTMIADNGELVSGKALIGNGVYFQSQEHSGSNNLLCFGGFTDDANETDDDLPIEFTQLSRIIFDNVRTEIDRDSNVKGVLRNNKLYVILRFKKPVIVEKNDLRDEYSRRSIPDNVVSIMSRRIDN